MNPTLPNKEMQQEEIKRAAVINGMDIVIIGLQPWYFKTGCNSKNIALEFAKTNRVLYVNFPLKRISYNAKPVDTKIESHVRIIREKGEKLHALGNNIWEFYPTTLIESVNWLPSNKLFRMVNYFNNRRFAREIREAVAKLGFQNILLFNDNDVYNGYFLKELLQPSLYVYYFRDFLQGYPYWKKHISILEPRLIRKSDIVVANSEFYAQYGKEYNPHSYYIGQGCFLENFNADVQHPEPEDLKSLKGPRIGYIGALDGSRLDMEILRIISRKNPEWKIILVGPEDDQFKQSDLHQIPNIHFLGLKPIEQLASYVQHFDVCINPQVNNIITKGNYPLKIDEYLAMGKPVVATATDAMNVFREHTYLAQQPADYVRLIQQAIAEDSPEKSRDRIAFARSHTWENCMIEMYKSFEKLHKTPVSVQ